MSVDKRGQRKRGMVLVRTAPVRLFTAVLDDKTKIREKELIKRAGYLADLVQGVTEAELAKHWNQEDADKYADPTLSSFAYKAWEQAFGRCVGQDDVYLLSRARYTALEAAGRTLRGALYRRTIVEALIIGDVIEDQKERKKTLAKLLPRKYDETSLRNLRRRLSRFAREEGRLATSFFDLEPEPPTVAGQVLLSATDRQLCEIVENDETITLRIRLPVTPCPATKKDWVWHTITIKKPTHLFGSPCKPTLRLSHDRLLADLPLERPAPIIDTVVSKGIAIGFDWGIRSPLVGAVVWRDNEDIVTDGRPFYFKADGIQARNGHRSRQMEELTRKIQTYDAFKPKPGTPMFIKRETLILERTRVGEKQQHVNKQLAHAESRWAISQAQAHQADIIVLENLATLEAGGLGRQTNRRTSGSVRGQVREQIEYKAKEVGIRVVLANPAGTSSHCPTCGDPVKHYKSSDSIESGHPWLRCSTCDTSLERDHASAIRIAGRGLDKKNKGVSRVITSSSPRPPSATTPARGPRAKIRRALYEKPVACSLATPDQHLAEYRSPGMDTKVTRSVIQFHDTAIVVSSNLTDQPPTIRHLDGLRSCLLGMIQVSPIPRDRPLVSSYQQENRLRQVSE